MVKRRSEINLFNYTIIVYIWEVPYGNKISYHTYLIGKGPRQNQKNKQMKDNNILQYTSYNRGTHWRRTLDLGSQSFPEMRRPKNNFSEEADA